MSAEAMFLAVVADKGQRLSKSTELLNRLNVSTAVLLNLLDTIACTRYIEKRQSVLLLLPEFSAVVGGRGGVREMLEIFLSLGVSVSASWTHQMIGQIEPDNVLSSGAGVIFNCW